VGNTCIHCVKIFQLGKTADDENDMVSFCEKEANWSSRAMLQKKYCCDMMKGNTALNCNTHKTVFECPDTLIYYSQQSRDYGIIIHDESEAYVLIEFCPWCGKKLK